MPKKEVLAKGKAFFQHPVGSGPFYVTSYKPDSEIDLARNPHFYGTKPRSRGQVPDRARRQHQGADAAEQEGGHHREPAGQPHQADQRHRGLHVDLFPSTRVDFIQLDEHFAPFKKLAVRQALNYAINRTALVKLAYQGDAIPGSSFMPYKMQFWDNSLKPYPYDPAKAKKLLASAGYPHGFKTFLITVSGDVAGQAEAVVVKSELAKVGITVAIQSYELLTAYNKEDGGHSQMGERYWTNDIIDPDEVATFGADCKGGANAFNSYWCDKPRTSWWTSAQAGAERRPSGRPCTARSSRSSTQQSPFIVIDYSPYRYGVGGWVKGFHVTPLGNYDLSLPPVGD